MVAFDQLVLVCTGYVAFLFLVAFAAERQSGLSGRGWLRSPVVYTLSLSIYCTAWTFYGAVGYAARSGLEFITIYLGPTIVFVGWWWLLRKLVRIGRSQRVTSIADLISARYGKSNALGVVVTLLAVAGTTPYIALQLQSVTLSFSAISAGATEDWMPSDSSAMGFWVAAGLAFFTILFGTRNLDANEQHLGVVMAIAVEAVVKLVALLAVGIFVVWNVAGGIGPVLDRIDASPIALWAPAEGRWLPLIFLSGAAVICLPRMFQVMVVENADERHLATASWAFPLYLLAMSLFVVPIAAVGLAELPPGSNPDLFVLTLPLAFDRQGLALLAFLGGFSAATSMVIVAAIALSTMIANHILMPLWLNAVSRGPTPPDDMRSVALLARRVSIAGVLAMGYVYYYYTGGSAALAAIGLIAFVGVAQVLPSLVGGLFWRGAALNGAAAGILAGFGLWLYTLFLPSFGDSLVMPASVIADGPLGIEWLKPQALFGTGGDDALVHALFWSLGVNTLLFVGIS
ncbi:MAG: sodium:solute symporter, partial [Alphaproteobacteria bacterium HGW-Alphaproteobacteria-2]